MKAHVIIYSRPGCHLCDQAKEAIRLADCDDDFTLQEVDIERDPTILNKYGHDIPVLTLTVSRYSNIVLIPPILGKLFRKNV